MSKPDPMDVEKILKCLNGALELQLRSGRQFTTAAGSIFGLVTQNEVVRMLRAPS